jgi:hypothetical protein
LKTFLSLIVIGMVVAATDTFAQTNTIKEAEKFKMIHISKAAFEVDLPEGWTELKQSTAETPIFGDSSGKERLTVSLFFMKAGMSTNEVTDTVKKIVEMRRRSEQELSSGKTKLSDYTIINRDGAIFTNFVGYEREQNRRFTTLVTAENNKLISFYLESSAAADKKHNSLADAIFRSIEIK